jgi:RimJ/RimL family protein N-acetyltransferase
MIGSSRIILTELHESDVSADYLQTLNDSEYMKYSRNSNFIHTQSSQIQYIANFRLSNNLLFAIKNTENRKLLGSINCYIDFSKMTLDLGFLIFKNQQGKGYASEALELLIPYLEVQYPGMTAVIGSNKSNYAMHEIAKKFSFRIESDGHQNIGPNLRFTRVFPRLNQVSPPAIPDFILKAKRIGVAAHDAGGAEQISWLLRNLPTKALAYIDGPANRIFENSGITFDRAGQLSDVMSCDLVITGSGWMSQLEVTAIMEAQQRDIPCITILDHWVNYLERFGSNKENLPQILAVTNSVALQMAQEKFPNKLVWLLPDFQVDYYQKRMRQSKKTSSCALILLEPTSTLSSMFAVGDSVIEELLKSAIIHKRARGLSAVVVRPHPSQLGYPLLEDKLKEFQDEMKISDASSLLEDLENSAVVFGLNSYAMYISSQCEIVTHSYFKGKIGHWTNYFPKILNVDI